MDVNFSVALRFTLGQEGGWSDNPHDPGGPTMKGITLATYSLFLGRRATVSELRNISSVQLATIYRLRYWHTVGCDTLAAGVDLMAFDIAVNMGVGRALQFLDHTATLPAAERLAQLDALRMGFWRRLGSWITFGRGWSRRETACLVEARRLLAGG